MFSRIWIRNITFDRFCLLDGNFLKNFFPFSSVADPDPYYPYVFRPPRSASGSVRSTDPDPSVIKAKIVRKTLIFTVLWHIIFEEWYKCTGVPDPHVFWPPGSVSQKDKFEDPDLIRTTMSRIRKYAFFLSRWRKRWRDWIPSRTRASQLQVHNSYSDDFELDW